MKILKDFLAISILIGILIAVSYAFAAFSDPLTLVNSGKATNPSIGIDSNGVIYAVWAEFDEAWTQRDIYLSKSTNGGASFSSAQNISNTSSVDSRNAEIFIDPANNLHIVWEEDDIASGNSEILYIKSSNSGQTFTSPKNISSNNTQSVSPAIIGDDVNSNNIYIVWSDETTDAMQIFFSRSIDGGINFSAPTNISNSGYNTDNPEIKFRHSILHIVWQSEEPDFGIFYTKSSDNGNTFTTVKDISNTSFATYEPHLDISTSTNVHIIWTENNANEPEIMYSRSDDSGDNFSSPQNFSATPDRVSEKANIYVKSNKVYVIWSEDVCNASECTKRVMRRFSANDGQTFSAAVGLLNLQVFKASEEIDINVFGNDAYVLWQQLGNILFTKGS